VSGQQWYTVAGGRQVQPGGVEREFARLQRKVRALKKENERLRGRLEAFEQAAAKDAKRRPR
jgi:predicted RNase H-like nuclease (RuvC/YqgF family)